MVNCGILPLVCDHICPTDDSSKLEVLSEVAWVLTYISANGSYENDILSLGALDKIGATLIHLASKESDDFQAATPLLRSLGNLMGSCQVELTAIEAQDDRLMETLKKLLCSSHRHIRKESLWVVSNLAASRAASERIVNNGLVGPIIEQMHSAFDIKKEAAYCLCNIGSHGDDLCQKLLTEGAIPAMVPCLKMADQEVVKLGLGFTEMMLRCTQEGQKIFEESGGLDGLELLEYHDNKELRERTNWVLDKYFYKEDNVETEQTTDATMDI